MNLFIRFCVFLAIGLGLLLGCSTHQANQIILMPVEGKMMVNAVVPQLDRQVFGLGIPETIGSREQMWLVNHPEAEIHWQLDETLGSVSTTWKMDGRIRYRLQLIPAADYVDLVMTIENQSGDSWHDVFAFNCVSPARAPAFRDPSLMRTYLSIDEKPTPLGRLLRIQGPRPGVTVYPTQTHFGTLPPFAQAFDATSSVVSDGSWMVVVSEDGDAHMATTTPEASFLFTNTAFGCIHAAASFGDIAPHDAVNISSRVYLSQGGLGDFLARYEAYRTDGKE